MNNTFYNELRRCCNEMYSDRENSEKISVNVNEKVYHPLTKKFTTPLAN